MKCVGPVRIKQLWQTDISFSDHGSDSRDGEFEFVRIGYAGNEKGALRDACKRRLRRHVNFLDGRIRRARLQPQAKQFQQKLAVACGNRQLQIAGKRASGRLHSEQFSRSVERMVKRGLQLEIYLHCSDGKSARGKARAQLIE